MDKPIERMMMEYEEFLKLAFKPRPNNPAASIRAFAMYDSGCTVSVTIGPSTLSENMRKPYEVMMVGCEDGNDYPMANLDATEVEKILQTAKRGGKTK